MEEIKTTKRDKEEEDSSVHLKNLKHDLNGFLTFRMKHQPLWVKSFSL